MTVQVQSGTPLSCMQIPFTSIIGKPGHSLSTQALEQVELKQNGTSEGLLQHPMLFILESLVL